VHHLEREVAALRTELRGATVDSQAARVLASAADRDVSQIRAELNVHVSLLNALRETQREQGEELREHGEQIAQLRAEMRDGFAEMRDGFAEMRDGFSTVAVGMAQITALLTNRERDEGDEQPVAD
jgi:chromosome segregation ATPase